MKWSRELPEHDGLYVWYDEAMMAGGGGPVGGLVEVLAGDRGWPCRDGKRRRCRGSHQPFLNSNNVVYWLRLTSRLEAPILHKEPR